MIMQQTLFVIPHAWLGTPLLIGWSAVCLGILLLVFWRHGFGPVLIQTAVAAALGLVAIRGLIPQIEVLGVNLDNPDGPLVPLGLAIRGYGLFLMLGILAGIALCQYRARQIGIDPERILSLCFWLVVCGLIGARLFYIVQKWDSFTSAPTTGEFFSRMLDMTEGGLVVYGSLFGGLAAWFVFCRANHLSLWKVADIMAPAMTMGLALGRLGCLMNGCCFGGPCDVPQLGVRFPAGAPVYYRQMETGALLGITAEPNPNKSESGWNVAAVEPGSAAAQAGIRAGDRIARIVPPEDVWIRATKEEGIDFLATDRSSVLVQLASGALVEVPVADLPNTSLPAWPSQLYSAITAFLLSCLLWFYYPFRRVDGELMAWVLILYSVSRFFEEWIRVDELGAWGSGWTISQWISVLCLLLGVALLVTLRQVMPRAESNTLPQGVG